MDAHFPDDPVFDELGEKFGPVGPLTIIALYARAKAQGRGVGQVGGATGEAETTWKVLASHTWSDDRGLVRRVVEAAGRLKGGEFMEVIRLDDRGCLVRFHGWAKWQARAAATDRKRRQRERERQAVSGAGVTPRHAAKPKADRVSTVDIDRVEAHYLAVMPVRRKKLDETDRRIIANALKVKPVEDLLKAVTACSRSDFHMKRGQYEFRKGGRYCQVGHIFKPRTTKGESQSGRIEWWLDLWEEQERQGGSTTSPNEDAILALREQGLHEDADMLERAA